MDALEIISEITEKVRVYQMRNAAIGIPGRPSKLLLGKIEFELLREYAKQMGFEFSKRLVDDSRPEFQQMKIYPVDDDSYIGVNA